MAVVRRSALLIFGCLLASSCGPDARNCSGARPSFVVVLKLANRPLPPDTVVHVTYGGSGKEEYSLSQPHGDHEVVFCQPADAEGQPFPSLTDSVDGGEAGAAGITGGTVREVDSLYCELWTGGFTTVAVTTAGMSSMTFELSPRSRECTLNKTIVLDSPDAG